MSDEFLSDNLPEDEGAAFRVRSTSIDRNRIPDLHNVKSVLLKDGPRAKKLAKYTIIVDRHTGEFHHEALTLQTFRSKQGKWIEDAEHSISLTSESGDEIQRLVDFLNAARSGSIPAKSAEYVVVAAPSGEVDNAILQKTLNDLSDTGKISILSRVLEQASKDGRLLQVLLERASQNPQLFAEAAAALNLATYRAAVDKLEKLVNSDIRVPEARFQELLAENPWMFGSEYSELLDKRRWTRDEQQDFVVRRTTDNYIELIEIKTPLEGSNLFAYDRSHDNYYPSVELSKAVGQVQKYIEKLDADRNSILANDREDTCKIRAKIIIGRDGDENQQQTLHRFNGHSFRIEVLTFDQLLKIAQSVLSYLESALRVGVQTE